MEKLTWEYEKKSVEIVNHKGKRMDAAAKKERKRKNKDTKNEEERRKSEKKGIYRFRIGMKNIKR